jgi:hypothetical protein
MHRNANNRRLREPIALGNIQLARQVTEAQPMHRAAAHNSLLTDRSIPGFP